MEENELKSISSKSHNEFLKSLDMRNNKEITPVPVPEEKYLEESSILKKATNRKNRKLRRDSRREVSRRIQYSEESHQ
jgi:hypothetical protein